MEDTHVVGRSTPMGRATRDRRSARHTTGKRRFSPDDAFVYSPARIAAACTSTACTSRPEGRHGDLGPGQRNPVRRRAQRLHRYTFRGSSDLAQLFVARRMRRRRPEGVPRYAGRSLGAARQLTALNKEALEGVDIAQVEAFTFVSADSSSRSRRS